MLRSRTYQAIMDMRFKPGKGIESVSCLNLKTLTGLEVSFKTKVWCFQHSGDKMAV